MAKAVKETHYTFKRHPDGESYQAIKMDKEGAYLDTYKINKTNTQCSCPAHVYCRHQKMLSWFQEQGKIGTGWRVCFETGEWIEPIKLGGLYADMFDEEDESQPPINKGLIDISN